MDHFVNFIILWWELFVLWIHDNVGMYYITYGYHDFCLIYNYVEVSCNWVDKIIFSKCIALIEFLKLFELDLGTELKWQVMRSRRNNNFLPVFFPEKETSWGLFFALIFQIFHNRDLMRSLFCINFSRYFTLETSWGLYLPFSIL